MTEMKAAAIPFAQLETPESLHDRVTRTLALQVIKAERNGQLVVFPNEGGALQAVRRQPQHPAGSGQSSG